MEGECVSLGVNRPLLAGGVPGKEGFGELRFNADELNERPGGVGDTEDRAGVDTDNRLGVIGTSSMLHEGERVEPTDPDKFSDPCKSSIWNQK